MNSKNDIHTNPNRLSKLSGWSLKPLMLISTLTIVTFISACESGSGSEDSDKDGLTNAEEAVLGTSPDLEDTDGDGYSDLEEAAGFNSDVDNFLFNPLIADVPKLRVEIKSVPSITLDYTDSEGNTAQSGVENSNLTSNVLTTSDTSSNSHSVEQTHTVGAELTLGYSAGVLGGVSGSATLNYEFSDTRTNESGFSFTEEQSLENQQSLSEYEEFGTSSNVTTTGGTIGLSVQVINDGDISFRVNSLTLGAVMVDTINRGEKIPVGNLELDTQFGSFSSIPLGPTDKTGLLVFEKKDLGLGAARALLRDASGLIINVALSDVVDKNGVAFSDRETGINANTASVIIDYGNSLPSERYQVATKADSSNRVSVQDVMTDILKIPYTVDANGSLDSVRNGFAANEAERRYWVAVHLTSDGVTPTLADYTALDNGFDFNALELVAGDELNLVYMEDADLDGVGSRQEFFAGTRPDSAHSDLDLLTDYEELNGFELSVTGSGGSIATTRIVRSNPLVADTDGDGINDDEELDKTDLNNIHWITDPNTDDTDGDLLKDAFDPQPTVFTSFKTTNNTAIVSAEKTNITLGFTIPVFDSSTQVEYEVRRQEVALNAAVTSVTNCDDNYTCYDALVSAGTGTVTDLSVPLDVVINDTTVVDHNYYYRIYLKINGSPAFSAAVLQTTTSAVQQDMFINIAGLTGIECIDQRVVTEYFPERCSSGGFPDSSGECFFGDLIPAITDVTKNDTSCEIYWEIKANGKIIAKQNETSEPTSFKKGEGIPINANGVQSTENTIKVPILPNACITIDAAVWEKDDDNPVLRDGDDELVHFYQAYCNDDFSIFNLNDSTGRMYHYTVTESGRNTTTERVIVDMLFSITPVTPAP